MEALRGLIEWAPIGLPAFIIVVTVIVFVHELGHYSVARACGVKIETFSIGFGRALIGWHDRHGTYWKVGWLPVGGYVKFLGDLDAASQPDREKVDSLPPEERKQTLLAKPVWQRMAISAAGPFANFLLAFVVYTLLFAAWGARVPGPTVGAVTPHQAAAAAGVHPGDKIVSVDNKTVETFDDLRPLLQKNLGKPTPLVVERDNRRLNLTVTPHRFDAPDLLGTPMSIVGIGISPAAEQDPSTLVVVPIPVTKAPMVAVYQIWGIVDLSLTYVWRMVGGRADTSQVSGALGMAKVAKTAASRGVYDFIALIAFISVSLGLINLFPIPVLDGGHLLYYACEAVLGRPLGERVQEVGFRFGLALVLGLMIFSVWNDLAHHLNLF